MNDLAEQALHGLDVARKHIVAHPLPPLAASGFAAAALTVYAGGQVGPAPASIPLSRWLGLQPDNGAPHGAVPAGLMFGGIVVLLVLWLVALHPLHRRAGYTDRHVWTLAGIWALPFVVGPPLLSTDVYSYAAHGLLARAGRDPYSSGPDALGAVPIVSAIDPNWRSAPSTSGPLGSFSEHLAVAITGGHALSAVLALRALAVLSVIAIGLLAAELAAPRRAPALALTVLNPAVLLLIVSAAHFEGVLAALLLGAFVAASQRQWVLAILLACAAAGIKPVAVVAVLAIIAAHSVRRRAGIEWRRAGRDLLIAAAGLAACALCVPDGLGWAGNLGTVTREHTPFSPASAVGDVLSPIVASASFDDLAVGGRIATVSAAICIVAYLLATGRSRPLERTVGYSLLTIGLLSPVLYPWYLLWGVLCLAPTARGARRDWVLALSCAACVLLTVGFGGRVPQIVTGAALVAIAAALLGGRRVTARW